MEEYGFIAFSAADKRTVFDQIRAKLGDEGDLPYWDSFSATVSDALPTCEGIVETLGGTYVLQSERIPNTDTINEVIGLNRDVGVSPLPEWHMRGEGPPSITSFVRSTDGRMIACANGSMRIADWLEPAMWEQSLLLRPSAVRGWEPLSRLCLFGMGFAHSTPH